VCLPEPPSAKWDNNSAKGHLDSHDKAPEDNIELNQIIENRKKVGVANTILFFRLNLAIIGRSFSSLDSNLTSAPSKIVSVLMFRPIQTPRYLDLSAHSISLNPCSLRITISE
jgi:hypothetical protein